MIIKKILTKIKKKLIFILLSDNTFINEINFRISQQKINNCLNQVTIGNKSRFYEQAEVHNLQNNKNNIIIGENTHIRGSLQIFRQGGKIKLGDFCYIGENSKIWSAGKIIIQDNVLIAHNVNIHDNISHPLDEKLRHIDYKRILGLIEYDESKIDLRPQEILIKKDAWIGFNATILKGVTVGEGAIIGAGSFVTKDVPDWTVVGGNPAKIIKRLK